LKIVLLIIRTDINILDVLPIITELF